jgi:hypothetical protein
MLNGAFDMAIRAVAPLAGGPGILLVVDVMLCGTQQAGDFAEPVAPVQSHIYRRVIIEVFSIPCSGVVDFPDRSIYFVDSSAKRRFDVTVIG